MREYRYQAYEPGIEETVVKMALNGSGIGDTARVLNISKNTVISMIKKAGRVVPVNPNVQTLNPATEWGVDLMCEAAELDEPGHTWVTNPINGSFGMPLIMQRILYWRLCLAAEKTLFLKR